MPPPKALRRRPVPAQTVGRAGNNNSQTIVNKKNISADAIVLDTGKLLLR